MRRQIAERNKVASCDPLRLLLVAQAEGLDQLAGDSLNLEWLGVHARQRAPPRQGRRGEYLAG